MAKMTKTQNKNALDAIESKAKKDLHAKRKIQ
jgi:hypothetical protein